MATQKQRISNHQGRKLHQNLSSSDIEYQKHLANVHGNFQKHLGIDHNTGFQLDGSFSGYG